MSASLYYFTSGKHLFFMIIGKLLPRIQAIRKCICMTGCTFDLSPFNGSACANAQIWDIDSSSEPTRFLGLAIAGLRNNKKKNNFMV
jgi:hypothetical protein